jgi:hypothetical protein
MLAKYILLVSIVEYYFMGKFSALLRIGQRRILPPLIIAAVCQETIEILPSLATLGIGLLPT